MKLPSKSSSATDEQHACIFVPGCAVNTAQLARLGVPLQLHAPRPPLRILPLHPHTREASFCLGCKCGGSYAQGVEDGSAREQIQAQQGKVAKWRSNETAESSHLAHLCRDMCS